METQSMHEQSEKTPQEKEEINWIVVILLAIFTGGIGVIIYFGIYFSKPQNKNAISYSSKSVFQGEKRNPQYYIDASSEEEDVLVQFCPNCGTKLERENTRFCPYCGTNVI